MKTNATQLAAARRAIEAIAMREGISVEEVRREIRGLSQILCKHRNAVQIEQNLFKAEVAQAAAALFSK